jgi:hypothetical protein
MNGYNHKSLQTYPDMYPTIILNLHSTTDAFVDSLCWVLGDSPCIAAGLERVSR